MERDILRQLGGSYWSNPLQRFEFIQEHRQTWPIALMCRALGVSASGFYAWRQREPCRWTQNRRQLGQEIEAIFHQSRGTYGSPRIHVELLARGRPCARKTVAKIMRHEGLQATCPRKYRLTTDSNHSLPVAENLLNRQFRPDQPNQVWVSDITAIPTTEGWLYLVVILDLFSRRVVGWSFASRRTCQLVSTALLIAVTSRKPSPGLLHHSDRGSQYACHDFQNLLATHGLICSMSRKGNCWDNAVMESFFGTLTQELLQHHRFTSRSEAESTIASYLSDFYNHPRRHSTLDYLSPAEYETRYTAKSVTG